MRSRAPQLQPGATVIPGHGAIASYADLERYIEMLKAVRGKIGALVAQGATLERSHRGAADGRRPTGTSARGIPRAW